MMIQRSKVFEILKSIVGLSKNKGSFLRFNILVENRKSFAYKKK